MGRRGRKRSSSEANLPTHSEPCQRVTRSRSTISNNASTTPSTSVSESSSSSTCSTSTSAASSSNVSTSHSPSVGLPSSSSDQNPVTYSSDAGSSSTMEPNLNQAPLNFDNLVGVRAPGLQQQAGNFRNPFGSSIVATSTNLVISSTSCTSTSYVNLPSISSGTCNVTLSSVTSNLNLPSISSGTCNVSFPSTAFSSMSNLGANSGGFNVSSFLNNAPNQLTSICEPLADNISQSIKSKIVKGEYIDLGLLLDDQKVDNPVDMKLVVDTNGSFVWKANKPKLQITSIHNWTSAFLIFSSVYLQVHPQRAQDMLKYMYVIRTAASRFGGWGWKTYDQQFRMRQQHHPHRSWALLDAELWSMYVGSQPQRPLGGSSKSTYHNASLNNAVGQSGKKVFQQPWWSSAASQKLCFDFNKGQCRKKNCQFKHKCAKCSGTGHAAKNCEKKIDRVLTV